MKIVLIVIDGLSDRPILKLGNQTPLEAAKTPALDFLARQGVCGLIRPCFSGVMPTTEEGLLALLGYDPRIFSIRRGFFTARVAGIELKPKDVALRGDLGTVNEKMEVVDRRAGRIQETRELIKALQGIEIEGVNFLIAKAEGHRVSIVLRGKSLSANISDGDPYYAKLTSKIEKVLPQDKSPEAAKTCRVLNQFLEQTHQILKAHPFNEQRKKRGLLPANYLLLRGASRRIELPLFEKKYGLKGACIAGEQLLFQIGELLGMTPIRVKGANGLITTNLAGKFKALLAGLRLYDFVLLHIKAVDSLAEDGNSQGKKEFIEKIDNQLTPFLALPNSLIVVTADHSTCSDLKRHCEESIPVLISGRDRDEVKEFSEKACRRGGLGEMKQTEVMGAILKRARGKRDTTTSPL